MQDTSSVWAILSSIPIGTLIAWIIVIGTIIAAICTGAVKLYKLFEKTYKLKEENVHLKESLNDNSKRIHELMGAIERIEKKFDERIDDVERTLDNHREMKLKEYRHDITVDALRVLEYGGIEAQMLCSLEELYESYELLGGNSYVHDLMDKVRKLPIKPNIYGD